MKIYHRLFDSVPTPKDEPIFRRTYEPYFS
jgi:hypothetical protein